MIVVKLACYTVVAFLVAALLVAVGIETWGMGGAALGGVVALVVLGFIYRSFYQSIVAGDGPGPALLDADDEAWRQQAANADYAAKGLVAFSAVMVCLAIVLLFGTCMNMRL
jgi:hypothetical protein